MSLFQIGYYFSFQLKRVFFNVTAFFITTLSSMLENSRV